MSNSGFYFRDDVINLGIYASGKPKGTDYLLALERAVIGSLGPSGLNIVFSYRLSPRT